LNSAYAGYAIAFGEKILLWLKYCKKHFPKYTLYGKADDDVFICADEFSRNLERIATRRLHYGWWHWHGWERNPGKFNGFAPVSLRTTDNSTTPFLPNIDEFLMIVGSDLVDPIIHPSRKYCIPKGCDDRTELRFAYVRLTCKDPEHCISDKNNWDTNYASTAMMFWINDTSGDNVDLYVDNENLFSRRFPTSREPAPGHSICETHFASHPNKDPDIFYYHYVNSLI